MDYTTPWCRYCGVWGSINAIRKSDGTLFSFRCKCAHGDKQPRVPPWSDALRDEYTPEYKGEVGTRTELKQAPDFKALAAGDK